ncbi:hypothetical protein TH63_19275 [Rufibacter radiotolerans]|uniref:Uncharacterized protein n=2 Tax=Rufibacter radiotolerans TaxID=1379910 RepID=A0A0H4VTM3_9BACT|nr:hypothetical protein TH63_19275 [Rufibacter radiotolerans]
MLEKITMKKTLFLSALLAGVLGFTACDSKTENKMEEQAEIVETHAEMAGDTALAREARQVKDSIDEVDPK